MGDEPANAAAIENWIDIILDYARSFRSGSRSWFSGADVTTDFYNGLKEFVDTGTITGWAPALVSNLPKRDNGYELDQQRLSSIYDIMVARELLVPRESAIFVEAFEISMKGLERIAMKELGLAKNNAVVEPPEIVLITIREDEYRALLSRLGDQSIFAGKNRTYVSAVVKLASGRDLRLALVRLPEQGTGPAQDTTRDAIYDIDPKLIFLVGIGGGIPTTDFTLGDVVVATRLHDFSVGAFIADRPPEFINQGGPMAKAAQDLIALLPALEPTMAGWNSDDAIGERRPGVKLDDSQLYGDDAWIRRTREALETAFRGDHRTIPRYVTRAIASSGFLIKDDEIVSEWRQCARDIAAVEMELSGVYMAVHRKHRQYPVVAIRGISDIVGFRREEVWTSFACNSAASFCVRLLQSLPENFLD